MEELKKLYNEKIARINKAHKYFNDNPNDITVSVEIINGEPLIIPQSMKSIKYLEVYQELNKETNRIERELKKLGYEMTLEEIENGFK